MSHKLLHELIKAHDTITIFGHVFPDGDCYGSQIGLKEAIKATYPSKQVFALGSGFPLFHNLISPMDQIDEAVIKQSLALVLDVADAPRIEDQRYALAPVVFKIDHHIPLYNFGHHQWIDTTMIAVAEMITTFISSYDYQQSIAGSQALALGLITDSGRFLYGNLTPNIFISMATLIDFGANLRLIYDTLYQRSFENMAFESFVYQNYKTTESGFIYCVIRRPELERLHVTPIEAAGRVNLLANIRHYPVWAFFVENTNEIRVEFRSIGPDVQTIAFHYGGGGHLQASGCRLVSFDQIENVIDDVNNMLEEVSNNEI